MSVVAIITARGGSKRIPKRILKSFAGNRSLLTVLRQHYKVECLTKLWSQQTVRR